MIKLDREHMRKLFSPEDKNLERVVTYHVLINVKKLDIGVFHNEKGEYFARYLSDHIYFSICQNEIV